MIRKNLFSVIGAIIFSLTALYLGYTALGFWAMLVFTFGHLGGFLFWLVFYKKLEIRAILAPYLLTLVLFIIHKIEERQQAFFPALSQLTGKPVPEADSMPAIGLYAVAVVWLMIPLLVWKKQAFGTYLTWTFFASMGISELAHFIFPLFTDHPYGYFPGMWSVIPLAPAAWWGILKSIKINSDSRSSA